MDYKYIDFELDVVEKRGAGRVPQEMAKSGRGERRLKPWELGIPQGVVEHKMAKTEEAVGARITKVLRREAEL